MASGVCADSCEAEVIDPSAGGLFPRVTLSLVGPAIVRIVLQPQSRIGKADGVGASARLLALTQGKPVSILLEISGVESVSRDAVAVYSEATTVRAFALLGRSPVDRMIAHSRRGLTWPTCPVKYFEDEQQALAWLAEQG